MAFKLKMGRSPESKEASLSADSSTPPVGAGVQNQADPHAKYHFFHDELAGIRKKVWYGFFRAYVIIACGLLCICSIYWGSYYKRTDRAHNLTAYVVNRDGLNSTYLQDNGLEPFVGYAVGNATRNPAAAPFLGWTILKDSDLDHDDAYFRSLVHEQHIWVSCVISSNATETLHKVLLNGDSSYNGTGLVSCYHEQATDYITSLSLVEQGLTALQTALDPTVNAAVFQHLLQSLNSSQRSSVVESPNKLSAFTPITVEVVDGLPLTAPILIAPLQVGLIYLIILSFFQMNFFMPLHLMIMPKLKVPSLLIYRFLSAQAGYLVISLFFCLVSVAFQIDYTVTFGRSGFLVFWVINYLAMAALGGATENVATVLFSIFPPALGLWLLFWVIINISPAFSPFCLLPKIFRYGYAFPVYNALELIKVTLCNTTKHGMGRNFGILIVWIAIDAMLLPFALKFAGPRMAKQKQQEIAGILKNAKAAEEAKAASLQNKEEIA